LGQCVLNRQNCDYTVNALCCQAFASSGTLGEKFPISRNFYEFSKHKGVVGKISTGYIYNPVQCVHALCIYKTFHIHLKNSIKSFFCALEKFTIEQVSAVLRFVATIEKNSFLTNVSSFLFRSRFRLYQKQNWFLKKIIFHSYKLFFSHELIEVFNLPNCVTLKITFIDQKQIPMVNLFLIDFFKINPPFI
jgi:hypothetical protein